MGRQRDAESASGQGGNGHGNDQARPVLPPRPSADGAKVEAGPMQATPTTALSSIGIQTMSFPDGSRGTFTTAESKIPDGSPAPSRGNGSEPDDSMSVMSFAPTTRPAGDLASLLAGDLNKRSRAWNLLRSQSTSVQPFEREKAQPRGMLSEFEHEFDPIPSFELDSDFNDEDRLRLWRSKLKHYMILSSAGKPIYSRHGDTSLVNSYMGVVQTIISFYEGAKDPLQGFTAGNARFVVVTEGPLYFIAISRLGESDAQLRAQLEALYTQILSTLTLPGLRQIFAHRPSTDLRKPLEGTEPLLSSLADSFTRGAPSVLLGALECLKLRNSHRRRINNVFLKARSEKLLYGLIVAGGKLVSVIRPRKHSLHPSDLHLIFNMLFESGGVRSGEGENWIPLCLPAFNSNGYLYMYVSFFDSSTNTGPPGSSADSDNTPAKDDIAMILISTDKEGFFDLQEMRNKVVDQLDQTGSLTLIKEAARQGRPKVEAVAPGTQIGHFLFKSRANVQFCTASFDPLFSDLVLRRRLMSLYYELHASVHAKHSHLKVLHCMNENSTSLAWITPIFEFYCVAGPNTPRAALTQGANKIIQWAKREEERLFIIGGGVF